MGLRVTELELADFRSFGRLSVRLADAVTVFVGPNAAGKTNTVEALQLLTAGQSFRRPTPSQLVRDGAASARAAARLTGDGRVIDARLDVVAGRRQFFRNGKRVQAAEMPEALMSVLFSPDDLALVKRGASGRRDELDDFGRQANRGYANVLSAYLRSVEQRNRLLKDEWPDAGLLDAWDASVALGGATLLAARLRLFSRLAEKVSAVYEAVSGGELLSCSYVCTLGEGLEGACRDELRDAFLERLRAGRDEDLRRRQTCAGPHRDDVSFVIEGHDARAFGSQGQQRTVALALKMAEVELAGEIVGSRPLLLLDDVMSELDESRRSAVMDFVRGGIQTVVTTTNLGYFSPELLEAAEVVRFGERS
ncbi:DNA replication/repair protein RecF [Olsenella sp. An188]|uniref:DNA replication/repair protein RecF n=1 Tax=Olsenella sp. An188 TaxID=1965579 RepID=UPI000B39FA2C|nr:DNA replication and repair protein RecF [Olsenella sp. An188]OUP38087.1 DNA replication and repair protein RecF [Olsenella sp. An188]